jgi:hypothetical protein
VLQVKPHVPPLQAAVALATWVVHWLPQLPQLWTSLRVLQQVPLQQLCPLMQQATAPPLAMQGAPPASLQVPQAVTQAVNAGSRWPVAA